MKDTGRMIKEMDMAGIQQARRLYILPATITYYLLSYFNCSLSFSLKYSKQRAQSI